MELDLTRVEEIIDKYRDERGGLIGALQDIQESFGWLPQPALRRLSEELGYPMNRIYSVATFYKAFSLTPRGRHVCKVCMGTACHVRGAPRILEEIERQLGIGPGETTADKTFSLDIVNCVGACAIGPVIDIDGEHKGNLTPGKVAAILKEYREAT